MSVQLSLPFPQKAKDLENMSKRIVELEVERVRAQEALANYDNRERD